MKNGSQNFNQTVTKRESFFIFAVSGRSTGGAHRQKVVNIIIYFLWFYAEYLQEGGKEKYRVVKSETTGVITAFCTCSNKIIHATAA